MATVTDDPLSKKVEMTNWEKVWLHCRPQLAYQWQRDIKTNTETVS